MIPNADARSASAFMGVAQNPSLATCFTNANGRITFNASQACGLKQQFCVALPIDNAVSHDITVSITPNPNGNGIGCFGVSVDRFGASQGGTGEVWQTEFSSPEPIDLGNLSVPNSGGLFVCCDMFGGASLDSVNWTQ
jgi:hypothetical protein